MLKHLIGLSFFKHMTLSLGVSSFLIGSVLPAVAGGFTQPKGDGFTSLTFRTFESGTFEKLELQGYVEYGLEEDKTLLLKVPYQWLEQEGLTTQGFADLELGGRWRYFQDVNRKSTLAAAVQGVVIIPPGYDSNAQPALGTGDVGFELRLPVSQSYMLGKKPGYWTVEAAYRNYFGSRSDEFRAFAEVSQEVVKPVSLALQLDYINALENDQVFRPEDVNITKLIGQVRIKALEKTTVVVGAYGNITGPDASGFEVQVWQLF